MGRFVGVVCALVALTAPAPAAAAIQPGDPIDSGNCTLGWLFDDTKGTTYFATAAHCVQLGDTVRLGDDVTPLNPQGEELGVVRVRGDQTVGETDVALIEVRAALRPQVAGELRGHPGIPSGVALGAVQGDALQFSGWGMATDATQPTREQRQGVLLGLPAQGRAWEGIAATTGGDSGGPVAHAASRGALGLVKGNATCSTGSDGGSCRLMNGPTVAGIEAVGRAAGLKLRLRRAGETAPVLASTDTAPRPAAPATTQTSRPAATSSSSPSGSPTAPAACRDAAAPTARIARLSARRGRVQISGTAADAGCAARVARVEVAVGRGARFAAAKGTDRWSLIRRTRLRRGRHTVTVRVVDAAGNRTEVRRAVSVR